MEYKTFDLEIKELTEEGKFSGYLSTFGNIDDGGDVVDPGAFKKTLKESKAFPLSWQHQFGTPDLVIGSFEAKEDEKGLFINGEFFIDQEGGNRAYKLAKKLYEKSIKIGLSMGYRTIKDAIEKIEGGFIRHLKEIRLKEGAISLFPMNKLAGVTQLKEEGEEEEGETKPSKENHVCRINNGEYSIFRSEKREHNGKPYTVRFGKKKSDGKMEEYEYFYPVASWTAAEAQAHCKNHKGSFEPALKKDEDLEFVCQSCGQALKKEPEKSTPPEPPGLKPEEIHSALKKIADELKSES